jgi:penicillin-binding protein 1A
LLEESKNTSSKVTSEYDALTMVDMMRGVVNGGPASGASAAGHPLAGKTGTVNAHTDVWFIGYTPSYATGVWMGNPERKESLGRGMTGGGGALPFFNGFMNAFMKDKPKESFPAVPPMPAEIKYKMERNRREELEKLEKAEQAAIKSGATFDANSNTSTGATPIDPASPGVEPGGGSSDAPKTNPVADDPPAIRPPVQQPPSRNPDTQPAAPPEGKKRKGKKGDG